MNRLRPYTREQGFSLIEVLVAMIILAVGLLGIAGLFANSLKSTDNAYMHSQAVVLAYDMGDRIRANPSVLADYAQTPPATAPNKDCHASVCTKAELALADLYEWNTTVTNTLPGGNTSVAVNGSAATVTVGWNNRGQTHSFAIVIQL